MRRYLVPIVALVLLGGVLSTAYALSQPPAQKTLVVALENMKTYRFTREVNFNQYRVYVVDNGDSRSIRKQFLYTGRMMATGSVDLTSGRVQEHEEFYINGSLVMEGDALVDLNTGRISGTVTLADGTSMDIVTFWEKYYGISQEQALEAIKANLPTLLLRNVAVNSGNVQIVGDSPSLMDRILMGLGLKEKLFKYRIQVGSGKEWRVLVTSRGVPVEFEYTDPDAHMVIHITPEE
ncbi:hypothetical protein GQS_02575 [Thermococcus sp. 4557]|uniref:hypothetical protein n=1 Tax=Thermococcus sp. (strain CGMCC 1.5172 / 4557) TaxID=1042877 RepID=UPI000219EE52|nr:hypothetical protein [Thermococcus sp. 4557]AEK72416.1 hypothetical protein GQS_02575 [Thermococcus sp. 4557]